VFFFGWPSQPIRAFKSFLIALIGQKKSGAPQKPLYFGHVNQVTVNSMYRIIAQFFPFVLVTEPSKFDQVGLAPMLNQEKLGIGLDFKFAFLAFEVCVSIPSLNTSTDKK